MKIPSEAELIEMDQRAAYLMECASDLRDEADGLRVSTEGYSQAWKRRNARNEATSKDREADYFELIAGDFKTLVSLVRELRAVSK